MKVRRGGKSIDNPSKKFVMLLGTLSPAAALNGGSNLPLRLPARHEREHQHQIGLRSPAAVHSSRSQDSASRLLQLRGGGLIEILTNAYLGVPIVTRAWLTLILTFASLAQFGVIRPEVLELDAPAIVRGLQLWRPVTAASFLGGINAQLLQKGHGLVTFGKNLEHVLGGGEFARVLASCTALLCIICNFLGWPFVGDALVMAITVLTCTMNPDQQTSMYGLAFPVVYLPFAQLTLSYLFTQQLPWPDIVGLVVGYFHYWINDNVKSDADIWAKQARLTSKGGGGGSKKAGPKRKKPKSKMATLKDCSTGS